MDTRLPRAHGSAGTATDEVLEGARRTAGAEGANHAALLFAEWGEHIRATDEKRMHLFVGYVTLLAITLAIMVPSDAEVTGFRPTWTSLVVYGILILVGGMVVFMLDAYRGWKVHYIVLTRRIAFDELDLDHRLLPYWLKR